VQTTDYASGRLIDLHGDPADPVVLLWHGRQTDARASVRVLAELLAARGRHVLAPDWNSHAADSGHADLLASMAFARRRSVDPDAVVLVGWSMGGLAAADLTVNTDLRVAHTVCLAGAFMVPGPLSRQPVADGLAGREPSPITLLHGRDDDVVPVTASRDFRDALQAAGWPVEFAELAADHGSIAGARYDADGDRYVPAEDDATRWVADDVAGRIAAVSTR
jgi:dienelactone hydrolase